MSEVLFKNEGGEYRAGDKVFYVTSGYGHKINYGIGTFVGVTPNKGVQLLVTATKSHWEAVDGLPYSYNDDGYPTWNSQHGENHRYVSYATKRELKRVQTVYERKTTLQCNRIMAIPKQ